VTEPAYLAETRTAYDTVAVNYAEMLRDNLARMPFDRAMLGLFAETVSGPVVEVGCGPGRIAGYLSSLGMSVSGIDLSPGMVAVARAAFPGLRFEVGSMTDLDLADESVGGLVAWYSIIHTPPELLVTVFREFRRVLRAGGVVLLAFQVGDERRRISQAYGHDGLSVDAYRLLPERVVSLLGEAGLVAYARLVRDAEGVEKVPQAYVLARK
jgi:SAM-dependent methyltransferase